MILWVLEQYVVHLFAAMWALEFTMILKQAYTDKVNGYKVLNAKWRLCHNIKSIANQQTIDEVNTDFKGTEN